MDSSFKSKVFALLSMFYYLIELVVRGKWDAKASFVKLSHFNAVTAWEHKYTMDV